MASTPVDMNSLSSAAQACVKKLQNAKVSDACIRAFVRQHASISSGESCFIADRDIEPVEGLDELEKLTTKCPQSLLEKTVLLKLNGGLGTGMGLHGPKSLLGVKDGKTFLDFTALQVQYIRQHSSPKLRFMLMDSFSTSDETRKFLQKYPWLHEAFDTEVEILQNQVPKILTDTLEPATWAADPSCEWAPPGHGDIYAALYGTGQLHKLLEKGYKYMFVSNGDNLGATLDSRVLAYMEERKVDFLMEVCRRTESDKKGGHLARQVIANKDGAATTRLLLRESAQCPKEDEVHFQDIKKYTYFNTNNIWISLPALAETMEQHGGTLPLPVIRNEKTVNPSISDSPKVFQLETAMGAAISSFAQAAAIVVPRSRFAPVKTCADLLSLRSDAYVVTEDYRLVLDGRCNGRPPLVDLDNLYYKVLTGFEKLIQHGVPSMVACHHLKVKGPFSFGSDTVLIGDVSIENKDAAKQEQLPSGITFDNVSKVYPQ